MTGWDDEEDWGDVGDVSGAEDMADEIPESDALPDVPEVFLPAGEGRRVAGEGRRVRVRAPVRAGVRAPVRRARSYPRRRMPRRTVVGSSVGRPHFRGALSTMPKLSWQHLAPGHYIAKARQGLTPGIRQHVLKLLNRAKGFIWINGKRLSVANARIVLMRLLATRASVDIKLANSFPFPKGGRAGLQ